MFLYIELVNKQSVRKCLILSYRIKIVALHVKGLMWEISLSDVYKDISCMHFQGKKKMLKKGNQFCSHCKYCNLKSLKVN